MAKPKSKFPKPSGTIVYFYYVIIGEGMMAMPIKSTLIYTDLKKYIDCQTKVDHNGHYWMWGTLEFRNPELMFFEDYKNHIPALIE